MRKIVLIFFLTVSLATSGSAAIAQNSTATVPIEEPVIIPEGSPAGSSGLSPGAMMAVFALAAIALVALFASSSGESTEYIVTN